MLQCIKIQGFKCFDNVLIKLGKISLFSGTNSSGKSSAIQALLLVDNTLKTPNSQLFGDWINLGSFNEVRNSIKRPTSLKIEIQNSSNLKASFYYDINSEVGIPETNLGVLTNKIFYLSANRIGPQDTYKKNYNATNIIGENGEFIFDLLNKNKTFNVDLDRIIDKNSYTLEYQVNYWLNKLLKIKFSTTGEGASTYFSINYSYNGTKEVRPYQVGAGVSYVIGIIILGLYLKKDSVLIIENPEIHLHPKAQSELADFLCFIANSGVQIIIESHSDHIFNGFRKAIYKNTISNTDVKINFFKMNDENISENHLIEISEKGKILNYQEDLFDQFDNDLDELLGL